jgi:hypothetical protein
MAITHVYDVKYSDDGAIMNLRCPVCGRKIAVDLVMQTTHVIKPGNQAVSHVMNSGGVYMTASVDAGPDDADAIIRAVKEWSLRGGK